MTKRALVAIACAVVGAVILWVTVFRPSEEDRVRAALERFTKAVSVKPDDTLISRMARLRSELKETVSEDVRVDVAELRVSAIGRDDLVEKATKAGAVYGSATCELTGLTIKIDEGKTSAKVDGAAACTGERGGERKIDKRDVHFLLRNDDGWKITTLDVLAPSDG